ncbi:MAG: hypothetical protein U1F33_05940 [Alphaproteobacteria bacterium]
MPDLTTLPIDQICRLGGSLAFSVDNALTLAAIRKHGHEAAEEVQFRVLRSHQEHFFLAGLKKLGLDREPSDAVRCAKFHVLSNHLGGLRVRYAEESPDKAWVVYDTPYWIDSPWTPSVAVAAIRPEMLIRTMEAWHANNGQLLGNPGLAYVMTTLVPRGDACDAGYFIDTHRTLKPSERLQLRFEEGMPPGLKLRTIDLDPAVWPLDRQAKAWRNFSVAYVGGRLYWLIDRLGESEAASLFEYALRLTLLQNRERIHGLLGSSAEASPARAAALCAAWHQAWGDEIERTESAGKGITVAIRRSRLHEVGEFAPPSAPLPRAIEAAAARAWSTVIAYDCPGVVVDATGSMGGANAPWRFTVRRV